MQTCANFLRKPPQIVSWANGWLNTAKPERGVACLRTFPCLVGIICQQAALVLKKEAPMEPFTMIIFFYKQPTPMESSL